MLNKEQRVVLRKRVNIFFVKNYFTITCKRLIKGGIVELSLFLVKSSLNEITTIVAYLILYKNND